MDISISPVRQSSKALSNAGSSKLGRREQETDLCFGQKRQLEVQLSEVSDETCDMAAATFLASLDDQRHPQASKKAKTVMRAQEEGAADVGSADAGLGSTVHASPSTGAGATDRAPAGFGQQLMSRLNTMGPPAAMPQLALGSLLVAAQMASGTACSTRGLGDRNSPLLPATQATLQATTASVVAAEVLAAVTRPVAMISAGTACARAGMHPTLAGWFAGNSGSTGPMAAAAVATPGPAQYQQLVPAPGVLQQVPSVPPAFSSPAAAAGQPSSQACVHKAAALGSAASADPAPGSPAAASQCAEEAAGMAEANAALTATTPEAAAAATPAAADAPDGVAAAAATLQAGKVQLPSWLCEPSAELTAGRAICQATLLSTTAALARLSSPRGPMVAAQMAVPSAAFSPRCAWAAAVPAATASPAAAAAAAAQGALGQCAVVGSMRSPSQNPLRGTCTAIVAGSAAVGAEGIAIGVPAAVLADGGIAWGLPAGICGTVPVPMQLTPLRTFRPAAGDVDGSGVSADAGSCSSSPKAAAAGTGSAREGAPGMLAAAAAKLSRSGLQYEQQEGQEAYLLAGMPKQQPMGSVGGSMSDLTADTASSPADEATSMAELAAAAGADAAAVVVHVGLKASKVAGSGTAAVAQKQQGTAACVAAGLHL